MIEFGDHLRIGEVFGCDVEGVEVAGGGMAEQDRAAPAAAWSQTVGWRRAPGSAEAAR
jgi:hypothetical protein